LNSEEVRDLCDSHHACLLISDYWQPVALVDFRAANNAKIPIIRPVRTFGSMAVCRVKKRLAVASLGFYERSATNRQPDWSKHTVM
jgi:hypothetical protein